MEGADWPRLACKLVGLQQAGVDLGVFLPQMGRMTAAAHQVVAANIARTMAEGTDRWADLLKKTMPEGLVRDAILASPAWPDIAAAMGRPTLAVSTSPGSFSTPTVPGLVSTRPSPPSPPRPPPPPRPRPRRRPTSVYPPPPLRRVPRRPGHRGPGARSRRAGAGGR
ncbi:hypothetical protein [Streptomyces lavendulae]